jgi:hypothetical protein
LKKPSSRGFACAACRAWGSWGSWGSWGLKTKNRNFFFSFPAGNNYQNKKKTKKKNFFYSVRVGVDAARPQEGR